jgi:hypothetical protein
MLDTSPQISYRRLETSLESLAISFIPPEM